MSNKVKAFLIIFLITFNSFIGVCSDKNNGSTIPVIFDTDLGNDIDDVLALQMLLNYQKESKINLIGITVSKSNPYSMLYVDGYCRFNGIYDIPLGYVYNGPKKDDGRYLRQTLDTIIDGKKILYPQLSVSDSFPCAYLLQRKLLAQQPDSSVIIIVVGSFTNIERLLKSRSDNYSKLNGAELIKRKVKELVVMAGNFDIPERNFPEFNVVKDIVSAQIVFEQWPTKIIVSGYETGLKLLFPHEILLNNLQNSYKHPLVISYKLFGKMPYDRPSWDLTTVLYVVKQNSGFFQISDSGDIAIDQLGNSHFTLSKMGRCYYLEINDGEVPTIIQALVSSVTGE